MLEALRSQRFTKVVRRSIHLTPFGEDFCRAALLEADDHAEYPSHQVPDEAGDGRPCFDKLNPRVVRQAPKVPERRSGPGDG